MEKRTRNKSLEKALFSSGSSGYFAEFIKIYGLLLIFMAIFFVILTYAGFQYSFSLRERQEIEQIELVTFSLKRDLEIIGSDIRVLAQSLRLKEYVQYPDPVTLSSLELRFFTFASDRKIYDQIRYINSSGMEVVRVNFSESRAKIVSRDKLQFKGDRYYFKEAMSLGRDEMYLSPLDLNMEKGEIERPFKPMLRVAQPIFGHDGQKAGVLILNYKAAHMLNRLFKSHPVEHQITYSLLNKDGYWLSSVDPNKEWGFMLNHNRSFGTEYPDVWREIKKKQRARVIKKDGLFLSNIFQPQDQLDVLAGKSSKHENTQEEQWIMVVQVPSAQISYFHYISSQQTYKYAFFTLATLLLFASLGFAHGWKAKKRASQLIELLSRSTEQSPAGVVITDKDGRIIFANPKFEELSGYQLDELLQQNPRILKSGNTDEKIYADLWQTITRGETWEGSFENKDRFGALYYVSAAITPIKDQGGKIEHFLSVQEDITERVEMQRKLEKMALIDSLTQVANRGHFLDICGKEAKRISRYGNNLSLLVFDLDTFKNINDTHGHPCGDRVLQAFSSCISEKLRTNDSFGRLGGEEFGALLVETDLHGAMIIAERLREAFEKLDIEYEGRRIHCTVSIGCTQWVKDDPNVDAVLSRADKALYKAKKRGRNRVEYLSASIEE